MRIFGIVFLLGILSSCGNTSEGKRPDKIETKETIVTEIEIRKTYFDILTPYRIDCDEFEDWGGNLCSSFTIKDRDTINQFINIIRELERDTINHSIDVRGKIFIFYSDNKIDTLCINKYLISINGESYFNNKQLVEMIEKL
jgi:hypothetical protein